MMAGELFGLLCSSNGASISAILTPLLGYLGSLIVYRLYEGAGKK
jgi:hypothetical protein